MRLALALASLLIVSPAWAQTWHADAPLQALEACITTQLPAADAEEWEQLVHVREYCPAVHEWLQQGVDQKIIDNFNPVAPRHLTLVELHVAMAAARTPSLADTRFSFDSLQSVVAQLEIKEVEELSLWKRLVTWLNSHFKSNDIETGWLDDLIDEIRGWEAAFDIIFRISMVLIVLMALVLIGNEMRLFGWRGMSDRVRRGVGDRQWMEPASAPTDTWDSIASAEPRAQVSGAIRLLFQALVPNQPSHGRAGALTNRELERMALLGSVRWPHEQSDLLRSLVRHADAVLYGALTPSEDEASRLREACRGLAASAPDPHTATTTKP